MPSSGMLHYVALVRIDVSEERSTSIIKVTRIGELRTVLAVTSNHYYVYIVFIRSMRQLLVIANVLSSPVHITLMMKALCSSEMSLLSRATRRNIPGDSIYHSHCRENLKSYTYTVIFERNACFINIITLRGDLLRKGSLYLSWQEE
jgi:hypothetical protein